MIVTVTPNPSIDRTISVPSLRRGEVHRATESRTDPGGKGVNVSRALAAQGSPTVAVLPAGGPEGPLREELLDTAGVPRASVSIAGNLRMNIAVVEPDGTTTKLNEPGPALSDSESEALVAAVVERAVGATWVVGCGSLPPGAPEDLYAVLVARARGLGVRVAVDSSGEPLRAAVPARPHLIKPNLEELEELVGTALPTLREVVAAAQELVRSGVETVVISLGSDGAVLVNSSEVVHARATVTDPLSTVGAGDCLLAGVLDALSAGASATEALVAGVRWGAAAVALPGSQVPTPADLDGIPVDLIADPDLDLTLAR